MSDYVPFPEVDLPHEEETYGQFRLVNKDARRDIVSPGMLRFARFLDVIRRMRCISETGELIPYDPREMQKDIIMAYLSTISPHVLDDDFEDDYITMAQIYGWPRRCRDSVWITSGRKVGKSYTAAAIVAADMIASRQVIIAVFSKTFKGKLLDTVFF